MLPSISEIPPPLEPVEFSQWCDLLGQLPLFPPAAQPPPELFQHISPLLRHKLEYLSVGRTQAWAGALTWLPTDLSHKVIKRLKSTGREQGLQEQFRGYRRLDEEIILANVALQQPELDLWFSWKTPEDDQTGSGWKLYDIRLSELDTHLRWFETIHEATQRYSAQDGNKAVSGDIQEGKSDDDDSYWDQYEQITGSQTVGTAPQKEITVTSDPQDAATYYSRYDHIETAIADSEAIRYEGTDNQSGALGDVLPANRAEGLKTDVEDYIKNSIHNLMRLALRLGISRPRLTEIINESIN